MKARFLLLNPNTDQTTTAMMLAIARETLAGAATIDGITATSGAPIILDEPALATAATEINRITAELDPVPSGIIIAAFGDPGLAAARARLTIPVIGIAQAAIAEAAHGGRPFAIVTTTPALDRPLCAKVADHAASFTGIRYTSSGPAGMTDPARLHDELLTACTLAVRDGAEAIVIGGGPLAAAARRLQHSVAAVLIQPIPAATRALLEESRCPTP